MEPTPDQDLDPMQLNLRNWARGHGWPYLQLERHNAIDSSERAWLLFTSNATIHEMNLATEAIHNQK